MSHWIGFKLWNSQRSSQTTASGGIEFEDVDVVVLEGGEITLTDDVYLIGISVVGKVGTDGIAAWS